MSALALRGNYELQLPNSFIDVDRAEMEYVDGGSWNSYRGWGALRELSAIIGNTLNWAGVTAGALATACASAATGVGVLLALGATLGFAGGLAVTALQGTLAAIAAGLYLSHNGFQANSTTVWRWTMYTGVKAL